jgi:NAD+ kinase
MQHIGVLYNPFSESSMRVSSELAAWLQRQGREVWRGASHEGRESPELIGSLDLLVALGGDGTVLRAAHLTFGSKTPILAVAMGHLSFMAELGPDELESGLRVLLDGGGWRDERALIEATLERNGGAPQRLLALNEVVITRGALPRVVLVDALLDDALLATYHADGVLVATATGSTAYALAAGGPIVDPRSNALVLVAVAAHLTNVPSMVLHEDMQLKLVLRSRHQALLAVDGRDTLPLQEGDVVRVRRSELRSTFARVHPPGHFYASLSQRLRRE